MNVSTTLIVIIMFTSIIGIGVANILMSFAGSVAQFASLKERQLGAAWLFILLLTFLGMFWNSTVLVRRDDWQFGLFLYVIAGPILLLFASSLMSRLLAQEPGADTADLQDSVLTRFFWFYAAVQLWLIGIDFIIGNNWTVSTTLSALIGAAAIALAIFRSMNLRRSFTLVMLALIVTDAVLQSM